MPIIINSSEDTRYITEATPVPNGWMVLRDLSDVEMRPLAEQNFKHRAKTHAEELATNIAGMPMDTESYDFHLALLQSTTNFNPANLVEPLPTIKAIVDHAKSLVSGVASMTITQMDEYDFDTGWPI